jgi:Phosphotransferase enzyme family
MDMMPGFARREAFAFEFADRSDDEALRCCLEEIVAARRGDDTTIQSVDRRQSGDGSSYASDIVTMSLDGGEQFSVFVKYFGWSRYYKQEPARQAEREIRVYRDMIGGSDLGTAEYCGALCDKARGRYWLFLEHVTGAPLAGREFECWIDAAAWLGRLHGYFADHRERFQGDHWLLKHDGNFFQSTAQRALAAVAPISTALADRLVELLRVYASCVEAMASQPATLVHGAFKPRHVLVDDGSAPRRLCPIDWELAAIGSNLYDLAFLGDGLAAPALDRLLDAYRQATLTHDLPLPGPKAMRYIVDCFRLHRIVKALGRAGERAFPETRIEKTIESGEQLGRLVC